MLELRVLHTYLSSLTQKVIADDTMIEFQHDKVYRYN